MEPLMRVEEVAEILSLVKARVYELARLDIIPHVCIGRQIRFYQPAIEEWILNGGTSLEAGWKHKVSS